MTKVEYLSMRKRNQINLGLMYKYYISKTKSPIHFNAFQQVFPMYFQHNVKNILGKLDKEFDIYILEDKNGKELNVW
jgi:hypothetical protein